MYILASKTLIYKVNRFGLVVPKEGKVIVLERGEGHLFKALWRQGY